MFEAVQLWSGNSKGFVSKILLLCVEVCNELYEFMHDVWLWDWDCVVGDTTVNMSASHSWEALNNPMWPEKPIQAG